MEGDALAQREDVAQAVVRNLPALRQRGAVPEVRPDLGQRLVDRAVDDLERREGGDDVRVEARGGIGHREFEHLRTRRARAHAHRRDEGRCRDQALHPLVLPLSAVDDRLPRYW